MGEMSSAHKILIGRPERERQFERPWRRWENKVKIDHKGNMVGEWIGFIWLRI
jgi:hypothetical protein